jgi:hypothetical protein
MEMNAEFWLEKQKERDLLEDLEEEVTAKTEMKKIGLESENWTYLDQYTDRRLAFLKKVMKLRIP